MSDNWQEKAKTFRQVKYGSPSTAWTQGLARRFKMIQSKVNLDGAKVLDVGCGVGMFLDQFKKAGADVYGIDVDEKKIEIAKENFENVQVAPSEEMPFDDDKFDVVLLHEVIEHVNDDRKTIEECQRVLKKGGKLIVFAPNRLWPFETHGIFWNDEYKFGNKPFVTYLPDNLFRQLTPHVRNYFKKDFTRLYEELSLSKVYYRGVFPGFDKFSKKIPIVGKFIQRFFWFLEKTPLHVFGISHFFILEKS